MKPIRIQRKRTNGWKMPENTLYVGRGSRWGNPFRIVKYSDGKWAIKTDGSEECTKILIKHCHAVYDTKEEATADAIKCYTFWLFPSTHSMQIDDIKSLRGKNLACWCRLDCACHADVLLKLANE